VSMNLNCLLPETRKAFIAVIRQFAIDNGAAKDLGLEGAEQAILHEIEVGRIKLSYDPNEQLLTLEVMENK
jgi:hypothetical protein